MANVKSAVKRTRQALVAKMRNTSNRSAIKTAIRRFETAVAAGDVAAARTALQKSTILLDKAVAKGVIHKNMAARKKSRLAKRLASMNSAS